MILANSTVWADYFRGAATPRADRLDVLLGTEPIAMRCIESRMANLYSDRDFDPFVEHLGLRSAMH